MTPDEAIAIWARGISKPLSTGAIKHSTRADGYSATITLIDEIPSLTIKNVIFNDPATIVFWSDGTKTVVKCSENDIYDPEKGLAMAFAKKMFGNDNTFHKHFKKWLPKEEPQVLEIKINCNGSEATKQIETLQQKLYRALGYFGGKK